MTTDRTYDDLAELFHSLGKQRMGLEDFAREAAARRIDLWSIPKRTLENAMLARGLLVKSGKISEEGVARFRAIPDANFTEFHKAATRVLREAARPLSVSEIIGMCGLLTEFIPLGTIEEHLRQINAQFIDGLGWWRASHFMDEHGRFFHRTFRSPAYAEAFRIFSEYGWPMVAIDVEALSNGKIPQGFIQSDIATRKVPSFKSVHRGLYVPIGVINPRTLPISRNVAEAIRHLHPGNKFACASNRRIYTVCQWLAAGGYGHVRYWKTARNGKRCVLLSFRINEKGKAALAKAIGKAPKEEF